MVRVTKRANSYQALKFTVVRLGNSDRTGAELAPFDEDNTYVGCVMFSSAQEASHDFNFVEASSGRYLTVQKQAGKPTNLWCLTELLLQEKMTVPPQSFMEGLEKI